MAKGIIQYRQKIDDLWPEADLKEMLVDVLRRRGWAESAKSRTINLDQDESCIMERCRNS